MAIRFPIILAFILNFAGIRVFSYRTETKCGGVTGIPEKIFSVSLVIALHCLLYSQINGVLRRKIGRYVYAAAVCAVSLAALDAGRQLVWAPLEERAFQVHYALRALRHLGYRSTSRCLRGCMWRDAPRCAALVLHAASAACLLLTLCVRRAVAGVWLTVLEDQEPRSLLCDAKAAIFGEAEDGFNLKKLASQWPQKVKMFFSRRQ